MSVAMGVVLLPIGVIVETIPPNSTQFGNCDFPKQKSRGQKEDSPT